MNEPFSPVVEVLPNRSSPHAPVRQPCLPPARAGHDWAMLPVFAALLLLFWSGLFHLHPTVGWVDPGLYIYWFLNAAQNATHRIMDYHGARLSYVVPGWILHRFFPPMMAQPLLVSAYFLLGLVAVHAIAACFLRSFAARAFVVIVIGANPLWIASFARGYVDGPSMALGLCALALLLRPEPPGAARHAAAGALLVLALCAHTLAGGMAGLTAIAIGLIRATSWRGMLRCGAAAVLGVIGCLVAAGLVAMALGMPFLFLGAVLRPLQYSLDGTYDAFSAPLLDWLPFTPRLILVPMIFLLLVAGWRGLDGLERQGGRQGGRQEERERARQAWALVAASLVPLVPLFAWFLRSATMMQYAFYAAYLFLSLIPALVLFARRAEGAIAAGAKWRWLLLGIALVLVLVGASFLPLEWRARRGVAWASWGIALGGLLAVALLAARGRLAGAAAALALGLTLTGALNADTAKVFRSPGGPDNAAQHLAMQRFQELLRAEGATRGRYMVWAGRDVFTERRAIADSHLYHLSFAATTLRLNTLDSLAASLGWDVSTVGFIMPDFVERWGLGKLATVGADAVNLITLCADPPDCAQGFAALREIGLTVVPGREEGISVPGVPGFTVALGRINAAVEEATPRRAQIEAILARLSYPDSWEAGLPQPALDPERRAGVRSPHWLAAPAQPPRLEETLCATEGNRLDCRVTYRTAEGRRATRRLVFERIVHLALLQAAYPPELLDAEGAAISVVPQPTR